MLVLQEILNSEFTIQENLGFFLVQYTVNFYIFHIQKKKSRKTYKQEFKPSTGLLASVYKNLV